MSPKNAPIIIISSVAVIVALMFVPSNDFFGIAPHNSESPSPMMVLESDEDVMMGFKITPGSCNETPSGVTESQFQITNTNEKNFEVILGVSFTDNDEVLFEKEVNVEITSGQTINQIHLSDAVYDNPVCVVKIIEWSET